MTCEYVLVYASTLATFYLYTVVKNYYMSTGVVKFITNITDFSDLEPWSLWFLTSELIAPIFPVQGQT
jgi:hypothetical protein